MYPIVIDGSGKPLKEFISEQKLDEKEPYLLYLWFKSSAPFIDSADKMTHTALATYIEFRAQHTNNATERWLLYRIIIEQLTKSDQYLNVLSWMISVLDKEGIYHVYDYGTVRES